MSHQPIFKLHTPFLPTGDQPNAIKALTQGLIEGKKSQVLLGITGSGKTFTIANVIANVQKPTLILAHNKTLAAQLYQEFKTFFPQNRVEYFVSYYDYYQPEAYIPRSDTYIEKDMAINDEINKMRLSATRSLLERQDVIIVSSVSCIYGLGSPEYYKQMNLKLSVDEEHRREDLLLHLVEIQYKRSDIEFERATFRVRGDIIDIFPAYEDSLAIRLEFFGDTLEYIREIDPLTGKILNTLSSVTLYPSSHHVTPEDVREKAIETIKEELEERKKFYTEQNQFLPLERIIQRTLYDVEMIKEIGTCKGIENYSRHFSHRKAGEPSPCLIDYFPEDFLLIIDESHQTLPQIHAMYNGDRARKQALVEYGFRLPSAFDNRPLRFEEFYRKIHQVIYVSATPGHFEIAESNGEIVEQIIRPTGLLDPIIEVRPSSTQVDDVLSEIHSHVAKGGRVLVTTLTKKLAEELSKYLTELNVKAKYLHADIDTLERMQIINELRSGDFDTLVGINLLREGLDIPEVSLVAILDADKEGFLRSETSLIQTCGRAARNAEGRVIMYADKITTSIQKTLDITASRRKHQEAYNKSHEITPQTIKKQIIDLHTQDESAHFLTHDAETVLKQGHHHLTEKSVQKQIKECEKMMLKAAKERHFENAARWRDQMRSWQEILLTFSK